MDIRAAKRPMKMYRREHQYKSLEDADAKFLVGIIRRYRREGIRYAALTLVCLIGVLMAAVAFDGSWQRDDHVGMVLSVLVSVLFAVLAFFSAVTPTIRLAGDWVENYNLQRHSVEIIDDDELKVEF